MTAESAPVPNYASAAFYSQYNLILFAGSALFSLASAAIWPLLLGALVELCWLSWGPRLPAFRRSVDLRLDAERRARLDDEVMSGMRHLDAAHTSRLLAVGQTVSLVGMQAGEGAEVPVELSSALVELEQLRPTFLKLCRLQERLAQLLQELALHPPQHEVARLSQAYAAEKDLGLRLTLHQAIKVAQRKIERQVRMVDMQRNIELKLTLIEQSLAYLKNQQQIGVVPADLAQDIRACLAQVGSTTALEAELAEAASAGAAA